MSTRTLLVAMAACGLAVQVNAQPPGRGPGGPGPGGRPMFPLMQALDADKNGEISKEEMENASKALAELDKNKDDKLTEEELRPSFGGGEGRGREGGFGGGQGGGPQQMVARMLELDANKDGKLSKDEIPERLQNFIGRADADEDGDITKEELTKFTEQAGRGGFGGGGPGGPGGPPNPEAFVERALQQYDDDKDGKLSKEELTKMAQQFGRAFGGGRGGEGGNRPNRPQRPQE